jgi:hypothetical protein
MIRFMVMIVGVLLFVAPLRWLYGLTPVAAYRTGTFQDLAFAVSAGATLYGGVLAGVLVVWRLEARQGAAMKGLAVFFAGWVGAMAAIGLALGIWALHQWLTTGTVLPQGQSPALLPIFPIIGGFLGLLIAGGAGLFASGLRRPMA